MLNVRAATEFRELLLIYYFISSTSYCVSVSSILFLLEMYLMSASKGIANYSMLLTIVILFIFAHI